jgi:3-hydroxymyristoyl/3-hydroxydecanoyl-(acyl carrier protein) dehydratase
VTACAEGRPVDCFGEEWASTRNHVRTPRIGEGRLQLLEEVETYAPEGGPWGRGYLRARKRVSPEDWFYAGHFKDDPCMPGTLMFEGCLQAMAFHLLASGCTLEADGSRFEPAPGRAAHMRCRRQVTPESREIVYEVFVSSLTTGPVPTLLADVLVTVDGVKAFHVHDAELRLVPDGETS